MKKAFALALVVLMPVLLVGCAAKGSARSPSLGQAPAASSVSSVPQTNDEMPISEALPPSDTDENKPYADDPELRERYELTTYLPEGPYALDANDGRNTGEWWHYLDPRVEDWKYWTLGLEFDAADAPHNTIYLDLLYLRAEDFYPYCGNYRFLGEGVYEAQIWGTDFTDTVDDNGGWVLPDEALDLTTLRFIVEWPYEADKMVVTFISCESETDNPYLANRLQPIVGKPLCFVNSAAL